MKHQGLRNTTLFLQTTMPLLMEIAALHIIEVEIYKHHEFFVSQPVFYSTKHTSGSQQPIPK
jgi:hypothetical protein